MAFNKLGFTDMVVFRHSSDEPRSSPMAQRFIVERVPAVDGLPLAAVVSPDDDEVCWIASLWKAAEGSPGWAWGEGGTDRAARELVDVGRAEGFPFGLQPLFVCGCGDENDACVGAEVCVNHGVVTWSNVSDVIRTWEEGETRDAGWVRGPRSDVPDLSFDEPAYRQWMDASLVLEIESRTADERLALSAVAPRTRRSREVWWIDSVADGRASVVSKRLRLGRKWGTYPWPEWADEALVGVLNDHDPLGLSAFGYVSAGCAEALRDQVQGQLPFADFRARPAYWLSRYCALQWGIRPSNEVLEAMQRDFAERELADRGRTSPELLD